MKTLYRLGLLVLWSGVLPVQAVVPDSTLNMPFRNTGLSFEERVNDLVGRLTLEEKISQMQHTAVGIERLGIPAYNWWNECLHGVGRSGDKVTVFPQAIGMAATFDAPALERMGEITSDEARAIYHEAIRQGKVGEQYKGLTFWTPNINIFRDPRWGRGQETYGEDPYLTGVMGSAIVKGLQGNDPKYLKTSACAKHYAVHSGPEVGRHEFDAQVSAYDLWDTYLPAFHELVVNAGVSSVMCAYNRFEGQPCCGNDRLMMTILRDLWGFEGYVTSDCGAIDDFFRFHKTHPDESSASADAVIHGTDLECGSVYKALSEAVRKGQLSEQQIDVCVKRLFLIRFRLGMFDPEEQVAYNRIPYTVLESEAHRQHALKMARESMVLLKNEKHTLPLRQQLKKIVVIGPNADEPEVQLGNYNGFPSRIVTPLEGIRARAGAEVVYVKGSNYTTALPDETAKLAEAIQGADLAIYVGGISPRLEGEEGDAGKEKLDGFKGGDRTSIALPEIQTAVMKQVKTAGIPLVFVVMSGSALGFEWEAEHADAIVQAWYGGQAAGTDIAEVLFGDYNPGGRLPVTFYRSDKDLPDFLDYSMVNRTYRYFQGEPLYPFGFGLSYTTFKYTHLQCPREVNTGDKMEVSVKVKNTGKVAGDEVVQLYLSHSEGEQPKPICALQGVKRIFLQPGESQEVRFELKPEQLALVDDAGRTICSPGRMQVYVGGGQPRYSTTGLKAAVTIIGDTCILEE